MPTIYRKYRPQTFADIAGQEHITKTIASEIASGKIAHAYLFSGPRGVGKTTLARLIAKSLNCQNRAEGTFEPCNTCSSCTETTDGRNIDVIEVDAASHTQVDNVRENIIENAQFKPTRGKYKIFIIDEVHMLSNSSFNALLKTLEEPPAHCIFILATTEVHKILPTIVSRCQRFAFQKIPYELMKTRLEEICASEEIAVDKHVLDRIINKSDGCLRDAESLLGQIFSLNLKNISAADAILILPTSDAETVLNFAEAIIGKTPAVAIEIISQSVSDGVNLEQFAFDLIEIWRTLIIIKTGQQKINSDYSAEAMKRLRKLAEQIEYGDLVTLAEKTLQRRFEIKTAPIPQLPLELLAIETSVMAEKTTLAPPVNTPRPPNPPTPPTPTEKPTPDQTNISAPTPPSTPTAPTAEHHPIADTIKCAISAFTHKYDIKTPLADVEAKWPEVIQMLDETNHSLTFILQMCKLATLDENGLTVHVPYSFHKEKLEEAKNRRAVEEKITEIFGEKIPLICVTMERSAEPVKIEPVSADALAAEFGGEVVTK